MLEFEDVSLDLCKRRIFDRISFKVAPGDFVALLGANGVGKTTLLRCVVGLIKPNGGVIRLADKDLKSQSQRSIGNLLSYVPQSMQIVFDSLVQQFFKNLEDSHTVSLLSDLGISEFIGRKFLTLSGGERQRVLLASALSQRPRLLLIDELTQFADVATTSFLGEYLLSYQERFGLSLLAVSHDMDWVGRFAKQVLVLKDARIISKDCDIRGACAFREFLSMGNS